MSPLGGRMHQRVQRRCKESGWNAFAHYVRHDQQRLFVGKGQNVIEIASNLSRAQAKTRQTKSRQNWKCFWEQRLLDISRDFKLMGSQAKLDLLLLQPRIHDLNC